MQLQQLLRKFEQDYEIDEALGDRARRALQAQNRPEVRYGDGLRLQLELDRRNAR